VGISDADPEVVFQIIGPRPRVVLGIREICFHFPMHVWQCLVGAARFPRLSTSWSLAWLLRFRCLVRSCILLPGSSTDTATGSISDNSTSSSIWRIEHLLRRPSDSFHYNSRPSLSFALHCYGPVCMFIGAATLNGGRFMQPITIAGSSVLCGFRVLSVAAVQVDVVIESPSSRSSRGRFLGSLLLNAIRYERLFHC